MKLGFGTMNDIQHQWAHWYKEAVEPRSNGRIEVKIFPRNQLGAIASLIEGTQLGTVEGVHLAADFFAGVDPRFGTFSIPVLFSDMAHAEKILLDPAVNKEILALGADKNSRSSRSTPSRSRTTSPSSRSAASTTSRARSCA